MEAYLDNSATTRCSKAAADMVYKLLTEDYGNPSSLHMKGVEAENYINDAKKRLQRHSGCRTRRYYLHPAAQSRIILQ